MRMTFTVKRAGNRVFITVVGNTYFAGEHGFTPKQAKAFINFLLTLEI